MAGKRKTYTAEFTLAAVKMITDQKLSVAEVARRLGVIENRLHNWKKALATKGADALPGSGHLTPLEEENRRLRAEVKRLEAERDILPLNLSTRGDHFFVLVGGRVASRGALAE